MTDPAISETIRALRSEVLTTREALDSGDIPAARLHNAAAQRLVHQAQAQLRVLAIAVAVPPF